MRREKTADTFSRGALFSRGPIREVTDPIDLVVAQEAIHKRVHLKYSGTDTAIVVEDKVSLQSPGPESTATFHGPAESAARLLAGRLKPGHTPDQVEVTGNVNLVDLRRVFPGY